MTREHPFSVANPEMTARQRWLVVAVGAYLWASAFGALVVPGTGLSYANLAFILLLTAIGGSRPVEDWLVAVGLLFLMAMDLLFRQFTEEWQGLGYSLNIGRMAIFVLIGRQYWELPAHARSGVLITFGLAAFCSELYVFYEPSYRVALFNAESIGEGFGFELYRPTGLIGDPNYFAVPLALMGVAAFQSRRLGWFLFACALILATGSRSAVIAVLLPVLLLQVSRLRGDGPATAVVLLSYGGVLALAAIVNALLRQGTTAESNAERFGLLIQGAENIASFTFLRTTFGMPNALALDGDKLVVHNTYLQTLSTSFALGLFLTWRTIEGLWRQHFSPVLLCIVIEMMFLDISAHSAFFLIFLLYSTPVERTSSLHDLD